MLRMFNDGVAMLLLYLSLLLLMHRKVRSGWMDRGRD
jgi:hypothetical protein